MTLRPGSTEPILLSRQSLGRLVEGVQTPGYDPSALRPGIVHLGLGAFHRAHMARYTHDLMNQDAATSAWGIVGAGLLATDASLHAALAAQDRLYTLVEQDGAAPSATVIGALAGLVQAGQDSSALLKAIDGPGVRIVSLTVTEAGYGLNRATKTLDPDHPGIARDLTTPHNPQSAIGVLAEGLNRRRLSGRPAFTALSCDNIQHNGQVLKAAVLAFAARRDPALADWIAAHARFPSTMVDRITPVTRPEVMAELTARYGYVDRAPVFSERFSQWVIEDDFADGRPDWDRVGAQFVGDVAPYEAMKLRLLNASHLAIAALGRLTDRAFIHEVLADGLMRRYMRALMDRETGPTVPPAPGIDLASYKAALVERFANPAIQDTVERVNTDAALNYLLDPIRDRLRGGQPIELLALAVAAWMRRMRGVDENGAPIDIRHPLADALKARAVEGGADPRPLLGLRGLFGELGEDARMVEPVGRWLALLYQVGAQRALARAARDLDF